MRTRATSKTTTRYRHASVEVRIRTCTFLGFKTTFAQFCRLGAYGEVRKCLHKETKALRAVKIINKKFLEEEEKAKLLGEIAILK